MSDATDKDDDTALAAEYVLGLLAPDEERLVADRIAHDAVFAALVQDWENDLTQIADEVAEVAPPPRVLANIRRVLFAEQDAPWWRRLGLIPALSGAVAAALVAFAALQFGMLDPGPQTPVPQFQARVAAEDDSLVLAAAYFEDRGAILLDRQQGAARPGRVLELWLIPDGQAPVSLGVLPDDATHAVEIPQDLQPGLASSLLAVSDEPPGGSTTGAPTGDVLALGPLTEL